MKILGGYEMVSNRVKEIVEEAIGCAPYKIGDVVQHASGKTVKIVGGQYWGEFGLSNFWLWREVLPGNKLGRYGCGYGLAPAGDKTRKTP